MSVRGRWLRPVTYVAAAITGVGLGVGGWYAISQASADADVVGGHVLVTESPWVDAQGRWDYVAEPAAVDFHLLNRGRGDAVVTVDVPGWLPASDEQPDEVVLPAGAWTAFAIEIEPACGGEAVVGEIEVTARDGAVTPLRTPDELRWLRDAACMPPDRGAIEITVGSFERVDGRFRVTIDVTRPEGGGVASEMVLSTPQLGATLQSTSEMRVELAPGEQGSIEAEWTVADCAGPGVPGGGPRINVESTPRPIAADLSDEFLVELGRFIAAECGPPAQ